MMNRSVTVPCARKSSTSFVAFGSCTAPSLVNSISIFGKPAMFAMLTSPGFNRLNRPNQINKAVTLEIGGAVQIGGGRQKNSFNALRLSYEFAPHGEKRRDHA